MEFRFYHVSSRELSQISIATDSINIRKTDMVGMETGRNWEQLVVQGLKGWPCESAIAALCWVTMCFSL